MDIKNLLNEEHSLVLTGKIVAYIGADRNRFKKLMDVFLKGEYVLAQRAAWPLSYLAIENPQLLSPYHNELIQMLLKKGHHPAVYRNILRIFQSVEVPEKLHGAMVDYCFKTLVDEAQPPAIRAFSMTVATNISLLYPELGNELMLILEQLNKYPQPPAIKSRLKQSFKKLKK
jgi:hypothetical protein